METFPNNYYTKFIFFKKYIICMLIFVCVFKKEYRYFSTQKPKKKQKAKVILRNVFQLRPSSLLTMREVMNQEDGDRGGRNEYVINIPHNQSNSSFVKY